MSTKEEVDRLYAEIQSAVREQCKNIIGESFPKTAQFMYGYGGYYVDDDNGPRACNYHRMEEKLLFGVHTFWECQKCKLTFKFEEINKMDDIVGKRISNHRLPWETP